MSKNINELFKAVMGNDLINAQNLYNEHNASIKLEEVQKLINFIHQMSWANDYSKMFNILYNFNPTELATDDTLKVAIHFKDKETCLSIIENFNSKDHNNDTQNLNQNLGYAVKLITQDDILAKDLIKHMNTYIENNDISQELQSSFDAYRDFYNTELWPKLSEELLVTGYLMNEVTDEYYLPVNVKRLILNHFDWHNSHELKQAINLSGVDNNVSDSV